MENNADLFVPIPDQFSSKFRILKPERLQELQNASSQPELTNTLLAVSEFCPTTELEIDDKTFLVGRILQLGGHNNTLMFYKSEDGRLIPRLLYKSWSDGGWRSCPGILEAGVYSKGLGIHYTQETKPHRDIVQYLDEALRDDYILRGMDFPSTNVLDINKLFDISKDPKPEWYTFADEVSRYDDKGVLAQFQEYPPGNLRRRHSRYISIGDQLRKFDFSRPELTGFMPDFSQQPVSSSTVYHTMLGDVTMETYCGELNNRAIAWVMARDKDGRIWIDRIHFTDTKVNSYGVDPDVIDSGVLTSKPIEYDNFASELEPGSEYRRIPNEDGYIDITPLLNNMLPIINYRRLRGSGGAPERVPSKTVGVDDRRLPVITAKEDALPGQTETRKIPLWQMTQKDWLLMQYGSSAPEAEVRVNSNLSEGNDYSLEYNRGIERFDSPLRLYMGHYKAVLEALLEGHEIPPEVLVTYPHLAVPLDMVKEELKLASKQGFLVSHISYLGELLAEESNDDYARTTLIQAQEQLSKTIERRQQIWDEGWKATERFRQPQ